MSRPIYEPSLPRADAELGYGSRQLFRRPAPRGGEGELPFAWMEWTSGGDVTDNVPTNPADVGGATPYDFGYINDAGLAMTPTPFSLDFDAGIINFMSPGLYHAQFVVNWADTFSNDGSDYVLTQLEYIGNMASTSICCDWRTQQPMFNDWQDGLSVATGHFVSDTRLDDSNGIRGQVWIKTGADKFLSSAGLIIVKLTDYDDGTGQFYPITS